MTTTLSAHGQVEIPEVFRRVDALKPGQRCEIERISEGQYHVRMANALSEKPPQGRLLELLLNCPVKGFFTPMERQETTDDLQPLGME